jgi:hypothetical protein
MEDMSMPEHVTDQTEAVTLGEKLDRLIHDPFGSVIAAVVLVSGASSVVYFGINALGGVS